MKILIFQHLACETAGVFTELWQANGHTLHVVALDEGDQIPALEPYDLLTVMGGPMDVWQEAEYPWLIAKKAAIRHWVQTLKRPYFGICLGHQLLAVSLGLILWQRPAFAQSRWWRYLSTEDEPGQRIR